MVEKNFQKELDKIIFSISENKTCPALLLHACCGPCSSYVLEYLSEFFDITVFYYNPNIFPQEEYYRRLNELKFFLQRFPPALAKNVKLVEDEYVPEDFYEAVGIKDNPELAAEKEKGERCRRCYRMRLERAFKYACENDFDYFCTTLSISPFKDAIKINETGFELEKKLIEKLQKEASGKKIPKWMPGDFKKKGGFKRSLELSNEYGLYRQQYCGCVYSKTNTENERKERQNKGSC